MHEQEPGRIGILYVAASIVLSATAQLAWKAGMLELQRRQGGAPLSFATSASWSPLLPVAAWVIGGLGCYALSLVTWLLALTRHSLSAAYPLLSLSYPLVYLCAMLWPRLAESGTPLRSLGIVLVLAGVYQVARRPAGQPEKRVS